MDTGRGQFQGGDSVPSVSSSSDSVSVSGRKTLRDKEKHGNLTDDGLSGGGGALLTSIPPSTGGLRIHSPVPTLHLSQISHSASC